MVLQDTKKVPGTIVSCRPVPSKSQVYDLKVVFTEYTLASLHVAEESYKVEHAPFETQAWHPGPFHPSLQIHVPDTGSYVLKSEEQAEFKDVGGG